jgi:hypothetical protein
MSNSSGGHTRTYLGKYGLGAPPLVAYYSDYAPTWDQTIWNKELGRFADENARSDMLQKFSAAIGKNLGVAQAKRHRGRLLGTEDKLTKEVKTRLDELDRKCTTRHTRPDCPFVNAIEKYLGPEDQSYKTERAETEDAISREITQVDMRLLVCDHMSRFTSQAKTTPSPTRESRGNKNSQEPSESHPHDVEIANRLAVSGMVLGGLAAKLALKARSLIDSERSSKEW